MTREISLEQIEEMGGKGFHLQILQRAGFRIPKTYFPNDLTNLANIDGELFIVRSSSEGEDGYEKTAAGKYESIGRVPKNKLEEAIAKVISNYQKGSAVIQPDLTNEMEYSGVAYTNINGELHISMGLKNAVQNIVQGSTPSIEITKKGKEEKIKGEIQKPEYEKILTEMNKIEEYFGIPMDIEFAVIEKEVTILQARPLPNPTEDALREHEARKLEKLMGENLENIVLGIGNYREILGNENATPLSVSTFTYVFTGDGEKPGATQLGRNELGYDIQNEIFPWVVMTGGKVYYNFKGDALQFRPKGISKEELQKVIETNYLPKIKKKPDLLNYPELRLYIQFPEQAKTTGLNPKPFQELAEKNRHTIANINMPINAPTKRIAKKDLTIDGYLNEIEQITDQIRTGSAREYVKAARIGFFALEDIRVNLEEMKKVSNQEYEMLIEGFNAKDAEDLRDKIVYDGSIKSFELPATEEYEYLGSFELSMPRGHPPKRHYKEGKKIKNEELKKQVKKTREVLEYREKIKFELFKDYDYLKQLYEGLGEKSGLGQDIYLIEKNDLKFIKEEPTVAMYRAEFQKNYMGKDIYPLKERVILTDEPRIIFGGIPKEGLEVKTKEAYIVGSVDQTIEIPSDAKAVFVPENIRPGSHLFTILSDYEKPVIAIPDKMFKEIKNKNLYLKNGDGLDIRINN